MARTSIRATYALDDQTDRRIKYLAKAWHVSQAEVIRRSVPRRRNKPVNVDARGGGGEVLQEPVAAQRAADQASHPIADQLATFGRQAPYDGRALIHSDTNALISLPHWARARHQVVKRVGRGRSCGGLFADDGYIAAIVAVHGFTVASRRTVPFKTAGLEVIDPWQRNR